MLRKAERYCLIAAALCVLLAFVNPALAWDVQEKCTNNMGRPAHDLTKIVIGAGVVTGAISNQLGTPSITTHTPVQGGGSVSIIHWGPGGPAVAPGDWVWGCFNASGPARTVAALWTDGDGNFIGVAAVEAHVNANWGDDGTLDIIIEHTWHEWTGTHYPPDPHDWIGAPMGPITGTDVHYAVTDHMRPLDELNDDLIGNPDIEWFPLPDFNLGGAGDVVTFTLGQVGADDVVVLRYTASGEGLSTPTIQQFRPPMADDVPVQGTTVPVPR